MANPPSITQEGVVGVEVSEQTRGREEGRAQAKSCGKSKAASVDTLEPRMATLKTSMSAVQDTLDTLEVRVNGLKGKYEVDEVCSDWAWHKRTRTPSPASASTSDARWIDVRKPDTYNGARNATIFDNFLFGLEQYMDAMDVRDEASKVGTAPTFLRGATQLCRRRKHGDMGKGICAINTWAEFQRELHKHFAPSNAEKEARAPMLAQANGRHSLKNWAKVELDRRGVQTLDDAITIAESLADYSTQPKDKRPSHGKGGGEGRKDKGHNRKEWGQKKPPSGKSGQIVHALLDTRATHNFISEDEAKCLSLKSVERKLDFSIVPMDDFKMVLGMEFFDQVHAFPLSATNSLSILDGSMAFMVPAECSKIADKTLSTMQFKKSFRKDPSFLVSIWELNDGEDRSESPSQVPPLIQGVLNEFKDVMPPELPKKLLPRREVDHEIELEQGVKPPALAPYWMAPPELEELRRHL
ncbi:hypothetical protein KPL70_021689 [Citrus sinensis]|nr:hypothetical protein KPL70_021689 [Citrus sinensis]